MGQADPGKRLAESIQGIYGIADTAVIPESALAGRVQAALDGGVRIIQYRDKSARPDSRCEQATELARLCRDYQAIFLVNDDPQLARESQAHGVHLGRDDVSLEQARALLGEAAIIGVSCYNDLQRAQSLSTQGADYVAFGSFFPTASKPGAVRAAVPLLRAARTCLPTPIVAIGGINRENGARLIGAGAHALAVIRALFDTADVRAAAQHLTGLFAETRPKSS